MLTLNISLALARALSLLFPVFLQAYGMVVAATDTGSPQQEKVAIKRICPFEHRLFCQRTYVDNRY